MFEATATFSFLGANGAEVKPPYIRSWEDLDKAQARQLERGLMSALVKLNEISSDAALPRASSSTNPVEVRLVAEVTEDGKKWTKATFEWPGLGEEAQALLLGVIAGELSAESDKATKTKEKRKGGKK